MAPAQIYIGCGCVIADGQGRYLLVRETKAIARGRWALPGGKLEADESIAQAAVREAGEETGLEVELDGLVGIFHCARTSENSFGVNFVFGAHAVGGEVTLSDEHPEVVWSTLAEVEHLNAAGQIRGAHVIEAMRSLGRGDYLPDELVTSVAGSQPGS